MVNKRRIGLTVLCIGLLILVLSLLADSLGIGQAARFGVKQTVSVLVGVALAIVGWVLRRKK